MVQVCIIIICIISFVLYDKIYNRRPSAPIPQQAVPMAYNNTTPPPASTPPVEAETSFQNEPSDMETASSAAAAPTTENFSQNPRAAVARKAKTSEDATDKKPAKGLQVSFYKITRQGVQELQRQSQAINTSGESTAGLMPTSRLQPLLGSSEMQYIAANRYKDFDDQHPTMIFKGQRHSEAARNMGLFFQITALKKSESAQLIEVKGWGALKAAEPDENFFTSEMTLSPTTTAFITGFVPRTGTYTDDEKLLFERDRLLKELNDEQFSEGATDIIMLIEFSKSN